MNATDSSSLWSVFRLAMRLLARDWRAGEQRVLLVALVVSVAALTTVSFFTDRVARALASEAGQLLGADLVVVSTEPLLPTIAAEAQRLGLRVTEAVRFPSMARTRTRSVLAEVKAVASGYPLRGRLRIRQSETGAEVESGGIPLRGTVWIDERLVRRLGVSIGDSIELGARLFMVAAVVSEEPEASTGFMNLGPRLMFNVEDLPSTQLIQSGSRVGYRLFVAGEEGALAAFRSSAVKLLGLGQRLEDIRDARPEIKAALERAERFLGMCALLTVILGGAALGLASRRYLRRQLDACAILRCLGASQQRILALHALQFVVVGLIASLAGCVVGYVCQGVLASLLGSLVPVQLPAAGGLPWLHGMVTGLVLLHGFALPPLVALKKVPALRVLRRELGAPDSLGAWTYALGVAAIAGLIFWQARDPKIAAIVLGGLAGTLFAAAALTLGMLRILERLTGATRANWRFGLANLVRHRLGSVIQVMAIALGLMALLLLTLVRADLLQSWKKSLPPEAPNRFLVNIQPDQIAELQGFFSAQDLAAPVLFPMVRGRLTQINDKPVSSRDFADDRARRLVDREFNLSWSASMQPDNVIVEGRWFDASQTGQPLVSVEEGIAGTLGLKLGDRLTYQIAGRKLTVTIASLRRVQWDTFKVNFFVVASPGVLESYPATFVTSLHLPAARSATMDALVEKFPNLVVIDVAAILAQIKSMIDQVAKAIEFVFVFSLAAGLLVLWAGIASTQDERMIDAAVMRAIGASRRQLRAIHSAEFVLLGALAGLLAATGATALGYVLATRVLEVPFTWNPWVGLAGIGAGALGVRFAGLLGTAKVLRTPPTEVFRAAA